MAANYTEEQVQYMVDQYTAKPNRDTVDLLAEELNKSIKSIIANSPEKECTKKQSIGLKQAKYL